MDHDEGQQKAVIKGFGPTILDNEGKIDRAKLADEIFKSQEKRRLLNRITHPRIFRKIITTLLRMRFRERKHLLVLDAPLLYESKILEYFCYPIMVVFCPD